MGGWVTAALGAVSIGDFALDDRPSGRTVCLLDHPERWPSGPESKVSMVESPHLYRRNAPASLPEPVVDAAVRRTHEQRNAGLAPILSLRHLSKLADISYPFLRSVVARQTDPYQEFTVPKRNGRGRRIAAPEPVLMEAQRWILQQVLDGVPTHSSSFAFAREKSCAKAATQHLGATWLVKVDFQNFFDSIDERSAYMTFSGIGYQPLVSFELARICSRVTRHSLISKRRFLPNMRYQPGPLGTLPQGAPTSGALANQHCHALDAELWQWSNEAGYVYTRYADDITISGSGAFANVNVGRIVGRVEREARLLGLRLNRSKTRAFGPGDRRAVLGILVDGDALRLKPTTRRRIDDHLRAISKFGLEEHAAHLGFHDELGLLNHVRGLIDYAHDIDRSWAEERYARLNLILNP